MRQVVVGVGDGQVVRDSAASLVTYALGSCVAVGVCDAQSGVGGMAHYMLPDSSLDAAKAAQNPWMFADTAIELLLRKVLECGADRKRLKVWAAGGAQVMDPSGVFQIGKRNGLALRKLLWKAGVMLSGEDIGGTVSRTVRLDVGAGEFWLRAAGEAERRL
jgi:chemotaxis protein CheD